MWGIVMIDFTIASKLTAFINACWGWIPLGVVAMFSTLIFIRFGKSVLGLIDKGWRLLGR